MKVVSEWTNVDSKVFESEIAPLYQPAILKGFVKDWPAVEVGARSAESMMDYIVQYDTGEPSETFIGDASIKGKFFYDNEMNGYNFERVNEPLTSSINRIRGSLYDEVSPSIYTGSVPMARSVPGFLEKNPFNLVQKPVVPRIWFGNSVTVQAHFDESDNIACVVHGKRRFLLFPPSQMPNMYVGPFEYTLAGPQVSMVDIDNPDYEKHPRFAQALETVMVAELEPGDAIYIPSLWWHHVKSLDAFNVLVNYWWSTQYGPDSPRATLIHGLLTLRNLPEGEKNAWKGIFEHYLFNEQGGPLDHLPPEKRGVLGELTKNSYQVIKSYWFNFIKKQI